MASARKFLGGVSVGRMVLAVLLLGNAAPAAERTGPAPERDAPGVLSAAIGLRAPAAPSPVSVAPGPRPRSEAALRADALVRGRAPRDLPSWRRVRAGRLLLEAGLYAEAWDLYDGVPTGFLGPEGTVEAAMAAIAGGRAAEGWERLGDVRSSGERGRYWSGRLAQSAGRLDEARERYTQSARGPNAGYYAAWAAARLRELEAPRGAAPAPVVLDDTLGPAEAHAHRTAWADLVEAAARRHGVDPDLVWAVMQRESGGKPRVVSAAGAMGLMQIMPRSGLRIARERGIEGFAVSELVDPARSIDFGAYNLAMHLARFGGSVPLAVAAYNGGPHNVERWLAERGPVDLDVFCEQIPFAETHRYVQGVLAALARYQAADANEEQARRFYPTL